jgi:DNA-binding transcriptional MocR family regulator
MQADAFLFGHLVEPGDTVIVERPTYDRTLLGLRQRGADLRPVELEPDGIDVDGLRPKLAHIIPNFQNPAGYTLGRDKRDALVALARDRGFTLFDDDPYVSIRFSDVPLPTMLSLDHDGVVIYASSFSKTVCPGIRVGYLVGPAETIAAIVKRATNTYIARTWSPNRSSTSSAATARSTRRSRPCGWHSSSVSTCCGAAVPA